jgi:hypothetical protein
VAVLLISGANNNMAKEILLEDGRTALFDDDASDADIDKKLKSENLKRHTGPVAPAQDAYMPLGPVGAFVGSTANSLLFGVPEMGARALGAGPYIESVRQQYPMATTAGDVAGLISPYKIGAKLGEKAIGAAFRPSAKEAAEKAAEKAAAERQAAFDILQSKNPDQMRQITQSVMSPPNAGPKFTQMAQRGLQRAGQVGTGIIGAQTGAAALGGARSDNYGAGAQQGAQTFRQVATNLPGTSMIPGAQTGMNALTSVVPGALGYGAAMTDYLSIDEMMRREAARRALGQ